MKRIMLALAIVFTSIHFTSCTQNEDFIENQLEQNEQVTQGEQEETETDPTEENN